MKIKKFKTLSILLVATLALAACQNDQADSTESAGSASQSSSSSEEQQTSQLSTEYYSSYISDGTYQTNSASGITAGASSQANAENLERGLYDLAKNIFSTEDYSLQEGQVIGEDQTLAYLTAQSDENPDGLNPSGYASTTMEGFEPRYLNTLMEYNFVDQDGNIAGISIGLGMNYSDTFTSDSNSEEVEITSEERIEQGKQMAETIVADIRENEAYADIPIHVAIFENEESGDLGGGTYTTDAVSSSGNTFGDWSTYNQDFVVYNVDDAPNEEDTVSFTRFRDRIQTFYPQLSGLSGVGYYQDNELQNVNIVINSQFDGYSEVIALSQQAISTASSVFNNNIEIQIQVVTADGVRALLTRNKDSDTFDYVLVD
ncbi:CamS family sex pheromone protein [Aerococcus sp.]|uniref:CamS family sex pheromone protein n=1 Tax=Aerococcus sp. TaxID=1872398 RepID=UPI0025B80284|nr:CamS family sex pheromone protein [Aerococcus sp.]MBR2130086.1 CamS family sex pheromone protein [Aerococcus sp.]